PRAPPGRLNMRRRGDEAGTRGRVLRLLRERGGVQTVAELAAALELHPNSVRFHLDTLIEHGLVARAPARPDGPGRPALRVQAVAPPRQGDSGRYRTLAEALTIGL